MDQQKTGRFISELRKEKGLTQQALGDILGVTNKTVSRWETGVYMPDIEMLMLLSKTFGVTINELLSGSRLDDAALRKTANDVMSEAINKSAFDINERLEYRKNKWLKDHIASIVLTILLNAALLIFSAVYGQIVILALSFIVGIVSYLIHYNRMMAYAEGKVFKVSKEK